MSKNIQNANDQTSFRKFLKSLMFFAWLQKLFFSSIRHPGKDLQRLFWWSGIILTAYHLTFCDGMIWCWLGSDTDTIPALLPSLWSVWSTSYCLNITLSDIFRTWRNLTGFISTLEIIIHSFQECWLMCHKMKRIARDVMIQAGMMRVLMICVTNWKVRPTRFLR